MLPVGCETVGVEAAPEVRYVRRDGMSIAYTRWGRGTHVVVYTPPLVSNVELIWEADEWFERANTRVNSTRW